VFTPLAKRRLGDAKSPNMSRNEAKILRGKIRECFGALALIAFFAHALIPTGFMPGSVHGQAQLVVCDGHMVDFGHAGHHGNSGSNADSPCPFALSGGAAPLPAHFDMALAHVAPDLLVPFIERPVVSGAPLRHTAPRGPPALA
jgi:hypothetical protein